MGSQEDVQPLSDDVGESFGSKGNVGMQTRIIVELVKPPGHQCSNTKLHIHFEYVFIEMEGVFLHLFDVFIVMNSVLCDGVISGSKVTFWIHFYTS